jgi:tetratricopeptide (TPR) repeat protein
MSDATAEEHAADRAQTRRRRQRLEQLLSLALAYRLCTRKELARTLRRDPSKLVPGTGIPKLDLVVELAAVLEWPVGDVVEHLFGESPPEPGDNGADGASLAERAEGLRRLGDEPAAAQVARRAFALAATPAARGAAAQIEARAWRRMGRYQEAAAAATRGLGLSGLARDACRDLQSILADSYYALWSLVEARAVAADLVEDYERRPPRSAEGRLGQARAHYLLGQAFRRSLAVSPLRRATAAAARRHLGRALALYRRLLLEGDDPRAHGMTVTIAGALVEADVALHRRSPEPALDQIAMGLERVRDVRQVAREQLEGYGWWCIYGCNIALRHVGEERLMHQHMAVFTNKADEIAALLDNWSMRERVFTMQYTRWERAAASTCFEAPRVIDCDDVRVITGAMGRFPSFRPIGWKILTTAQIVDG